MSTPRVLASTCAARAALAGNPSDGFGGAVVAVPIDELIAVATATEADGFGIVAADADLHHLLAATAEVFAGHVGPLPPVALAASTAIPRAVGLAGSSAVVIAALRSLGAWVGHRWQPIELAQSAMAVGRDRFDPASGLEERLVQSVGDLVAMGFDPIGFEVLDRPAGLHLFAAWTRAASDRGDTPHRSLRRRYEAGDAGVRRAIGELAEQAARARRAIERERLDELGAAMDRSCDLRCELAGAGAQQRELVDIGRRAGASVNAASSGGSVVGLATGADHLDRIEAAYRRAGAGWTVIG